MPIVACLEFICDKCHKSATFLSIKFARNCGWTVTRYGLRDYGGDIGKAPYRWAYCPDCTKHRSRKAKKEITRVGGMI